MTPEAFKIEIERAPERVLTQWAALEASASPFQTRAWLMPWFRHVAPAIGARPLFVTVRAIGGRALAFFPLSERRRWGVRVAEFPDAGASDYNMPLVAPEVDAQMASRIWAAMRKALRGVDLVHIDKMPGRVGDVTNPFAAFGWLRQIETSGWDLRLPASREQYDRDHVRPRDRKEHRRKRKNLTAACGAAVLRDAAGPEERRESFGALCAQRAVRFQRQKRPDILQDKRFAAFYACIAVESVSLARLSTLATEVGTLATLFGLVHGDSYFLVMHCFEESVAALSPGIVALDEMISGLIAAGVVHCDFTLGNESYKTQFGVQSRPLYAGDDPLTVAGFVVALGRRLAARAEPRLVRIWRALARRSRSPGSSPGVDPTGHDEATGDRCERTPSLIWRRAFARAGRGSAG